ncbi:MAG: fibronectin type III domain-containing protein, partial [Calditrichaeota bacterium]
GSINQPTELDLIWSKASDQLSIIGGKNKNLLKLKIKSEKGILDPIKTVSNYWLQVTTDIDSSAFINDTSLTDTTYHLTGLSNSTDYWWRVTAKNEAGWGTFTDWYKFTTISNSPGVPIPIYPLSNTNIVDTSKYLTFIWSKAPFAESYSIEIGFDNNFDSLLYSKNNR